MRPENDIRMMVVSTCEKLMDKMVACWTEKVGTDIAQKADTKKEIRPLFPDLWLLPPESTRDFLKGLTDDIQQWAKIAESAVLVGTEVIVPQIQKESQGSPELQEKCLRFFYQSLAHAAGQIARSAADESNSILRQHQEEHQATIEEIRSINEELYTANEEIKTTLQEVRQYKNQLQLMMNQASDAILIVGVSTYQIRDVNKKAEEIFGWSRGELVRNSLVRLCPTSHLPQLFERLNRCLEGSGRILFDDIPLITKKHEIFPVEASIARVQADGDHVYFMILRDIVSRKKAEEMLIQAKEDWENTFDAITDLIMLLDSEHRIVRANKAAARTLHTTKEDLAGKKCYEVVHKSSRPIKECPLAVTKKELQPCTREITEPNIGGVFTCATSPIFGREGKLVGYTHILKDITESKRLEAQFHQAQKLESVATLAGGVAHDFNNLLMGIRGYNSLMLKDLDPTNPHYDKLMRIESLVKSGADLTKQLLGFARKGKYDVTPTNLNEIVRQSSEMFGRTRKEIIIRGKYEEGLWTVEADRGQIEQVLLNLYVNAWQAMPAGGEISLETGNLTLTKKYTHPFQMKPGKYVKVSVTDTGIGMDEETQQKIFDPFFTTKEMGKGTGLGLASTYAIIKNHGGFITVDSKLGCGSTFTIYLPAGQREVVQKEKRRPDDKTKKGNETILLVDDEQIILDVGEDMLETLGYKVLLANSGEKAVDIFNENNGHIHLVILDMIMPGMDGSKTYDVLKRIQPGIKAILSTGYSMEGTAREIIKQGVNGFIQKPFSIEELSQKIREVLDRE